MGQSIDNGQSHRTGREKARERFQGPKTCNKGQSKGRSKEDWGVGKLEETGERCVKKSKWEKHLGRRSGWAGAVSLWSVRRFREFTDKGLYFFLEIVHLMRGLGGMGIRVTALGRACCVAGRRAC